MEASEKGNIVSLVFICLFYNGGVLVTTMLLYFFSENSSSIEGGRLRRRVSRPYISPYSSQKSRMTFSDGFFVIFATTMNAIKESTSEGTIGCSPRGLGME